MSNTTVSNDVWSDAPEGATHFNDYFMSFYKFEDGVLYYNCNISKTWKKSAYYAFRNENRDLMMDDTKLHEKPNQEMSTKKHKHHDLIVKWAADPSVKVWSKSDKNGCCWSLVNGSPLWWEDCEYHIGYQPPVEYITINGHKIVAPVRSLNVGDKFWFVDVSLVDYVGSYKFRGDLLGDRLLKRGLCHLTKENAIAHAKALLSFTEAAE